MITGVDLVREMIRIAAANACASARISCRIDGHSIEVRINAEDPAKASCRTRATITTLDVPGRQRRALRQHAL